MFNRIIYWSFFTLRPVQYTDFSIYAGLFYVNTILVLFYKAAYIDKDIMFLCLVIALVCILVYLYYKDTIYKYKNLQFIGWLVNGDRYKHIDLYFHTKKRLFVAVFDDTRANKILDEKNINSGQIVTIDSINYRIVLDKNK